MMKAKRIFSAAITLVLLLCTVFSVCTVSVSAASTTAFDILTTSKYAKTYTLSTSGKTVPYTSKYLTTRGTKTYGASSAAYIANSSDELYVMDVGYTNGKYWAYVSYPTSSRRVNAYIPLSAITENNSNHAKTTSRGKFYCSYRKGYSASSSYYVDKDDTVYLVATSGSQYQILYPISNGNWRLAWCSKSNYDTYCAPQTNTNTNNTAGMTDVTAYFVGQTIVLQSVANGKYLCADANYNNTPAMCNRSSVTNWTTFTVSSLTSDGWIGFKGTATNRYLSAVTSASNAPLRAVASSRQSWECFRIYLKNGVFYIKSQATGKFVSVRTDVSGAPAQARSATASTKERFNIRFSNAANYVSTASIIKAAVNNGISAGSNAFKALLSINNKYAASLTQTQENGVTVFMFEGVGNNASTTCHQNAMCVVVKGGSIVYVNRNSSTVPDQPFDRTSNKNTDVPTLKSGIYSFTTVNHNGSYAALNVTGAKVVRFASKTSFYSSTSGDINVHRRSTNDVAPAKSYWANSAGCLLIGKTGTSSSSEYASFIKAVGIVGSSATGSSRYSTYVKGTIVVDRTYAGQYLSSLGYSASAIRSIG